MQAHDGDPSTRGAQGLIDWIDEDPNGGVEAACCLVAEIRNSEVCDGLYLVSANRYLEAHWPGGSEHPPRRWQRHPGAARSAQPRGLAVRNLRETLAYAVVRSDAVAMAG